MTIPKLLSVLALAVIPVLAETQGRPNFSGTWNCDAARSVACPSDTLIVKHSGETLTVQGPGEKTVVQTYKLNGTETINEPAQEVGITGRRLPQSKVTARWDSATDCDRNPKPRGQSESRQVGVATQRRRQRVGD